MRLFEGTKFDIPPTCERCNKLEEDCECPPLPDPLPDRIPPNKQTAKVASERRKHGRMMTCVRGLDSQDCAELLVKLKNAHGSGGTVKEGVIEIQGDHAERVKDALRNLGYKVK